MAQFGIETSKWLLSVIKQRKLLLKTNKNHKPQLHVEMALALLERLLNTYSYENDLYMARFINQNAGDISILLPGKGATGYDKKHSELQAIIRTAVAILDKQNPVSYQKSKAGQYELF
jgi:hypothetical protein